MTLSFCRAADASIVAVLPNAASPAIAEMAQAKAALKAEGKPTSVAGPIEAMKDKYPGYALVKTFQEAQAAGNLNLATELAAELKAKYLSCADAANAALDAQAAWEAKCEAADAPTSLKDVLAKFAATKTESGAKPSQGA